MGRRTGFYYYDELLEMLIPFRGYTFTNATNRIRILLLLAFILALTHMLIFYYPLISKFFLNKVIFPPLKRFYKFSIKQLKDRFKKSGKNFQKEVVAKKKTVVKEKMVKYMDTVEFSKLPHKMKMVFRARYLNLTFHRGYLQTNSKIQQRLAQLKSEKMKEEEDASLLNVEENIRPHEEKKKDSIGGRKDINKSKKKNGQEVKKESETGKDSVKEGRKMCGSKFVKKENDDPKSEIKKESLSEVNIGIDKKKEPEQEIQKNVETKKETELHLVKEMGKDKTKAKDLKTSKIDKVKENEDTGDKSKANNKIILDKQMASNFLKKEEKNSAKRVKTDYKDDEIEESRSFMPPTVKKKVLAEEEAKEEKSEKRDMRADLLNSIKQRPSIKETSVVGLLDVNQSTTDLLKTCHKDVTPVVMRSAKGKPAPRRQTQFGMVRNEDKFNNAI